MNDINIYQKIGGFLHICRACLTLSKEVQLIFGENQNEVVSILRELSIEIIDSDVFPKNLCLSCIKKIKSFHNFIEMFRNSQKTLLEAIQSDERNINKNGIEERSECDSDSGMTVDCASHSSDSQRPQSSQEAVLTGGWITNKNEDDREFEASEMSRWSSFGLDPVEQIAHPSRATIQQTAVADDNRIISSDVDPFVSQSNNEPEQIFQAAFKSDPMEYPVQPISHTSRTTIQQTAVADGNSIIASDVNPFVSQSNNEPEQILQVVIKSEPMEYPVQPIALTSGTTIQQTAVAVDNGIIASDVDPFVSQSNNEPEQIFQAAIKSEPVECPVEPIAQTSRPTIQQDIFALLQQHPREKQNGDHFSDEKQCVPIDHLSNMKHTLYDCQFCTSPFSNFKEFYKHLFNHREKVGSRKSKMVCAFCDERPEMFDCLKTYGIHLSKRHKLLFICKYCQIDPFENFYGFWRHQRSVHHKLSVKSVLQRPSSCAKNKAVYPWEGIEENIYLCPYCKIKIRNPLRFRYHIWTHFSHKIGDIKECVTCRKLFAFDTELKQHYRKSLDCKEPLHSKENKTSNRKTEKHQLKSN